VKNAPSSQTRERISLKFGLNFFPDKSGLFHNFGLSPLSGFGEVKNKENRNVLPKTKCGPKNFHLKI